MKTLTITINGKKTGELIYFILNVPTANFLNVIEMEFSTIDDILNGEKNGFYTIK